MLGGSVEGVGGRLGIRWVRAGHGESTYCGHYFVFSDLLTNDTNDG